MRSKHREPWTLAEIERLRSLAKKGVTTGDIAAALERTQEAIQAKAAKHGISLQSRKR